MKKAYRNPEEKIWKINQEVVEGESIEEKVRRVVSNKEPITDGAPIIYQLRSEGVPPGCDIRTDRFEVALDAFDKIDKERIAKRAAAAEEAKKANEEAAKKANETQAGISN